MQCCISRLHPIAMLEFKIWPQNELIYINLGFHGVLSHILFRNCLLLYVYVKRQILESIVKQVQIKVKDIN